MILERLKYFFFYIHNDWQIGIIRTSLKNFIFSDEVPEIRWIDVDFDVYQADPFGIEVADKLYVFYEEFNKKNNYAVIKCSIFNEALFRIDDRVILDDGTHKSFPFVFEFQDHYYLMPESGALNSLVIYESLDFPFKWGNERTLLPFGCSDAIINCIDGKWYLFYTKANSSTENDCLYLRTCDQLFGDWEQEEELMVNNNRYSSRNAGNIYRVEGSLYRFAQNCQNQYGESVVVKLIETITKESFKEIVLFEKKLGKKYNGFHTLNATDNYTLVDRRKFSFQLKPISVLLVQLKAFIFRAKSARH